MFSNRQSLWERGERGEGLISPSVMNQITELSEGLILNKSHKLTDCTTAAETLTRHFPSFKPLTGRFYVCCEVTFSHTVPPEHDCNHSGITSFKPRNNPPCCFLCCLNHKKETQGSSLVAADHPHSALLVENRSLAQSDRASESGAVVHHWAAYGLCLEHVLRSTTSLWTTVRVEQ